MKREEFYKIYKEITGKYWISIIDNDYETNNFKFWSYEGDVFILDKINCIMINWYKRYHIGRALFVPKEIGDSRSLREFLKRWVDDYKEIKCFE